MSLIFDNSNISYVTSTGGEIKNQTINPQYIIETNSAAAHNFNTIQEFTDYLGVSSTYKKTIDSLLELPRQEDWTFSNSNFVMNSSKNSQETITGQTYKTTKYYYYWNYSVKQEQITSYNDRTNIYETYVKVSKEIDSKDISDSNRLIIEKNENVPNSTSYVNQSSQEICITYIYTEEIEEEVEPTPVDPDPIEYGAFPTGTSADYCILLCHTDAENESYIEDIRKVTQQDLDSWALSYMEQIGIETSVTSFYGKDSQGYYVLVAKDSIDRENFQNEWDSVWSNTRAANEITNELNSTEDSYKVYVAGWCQLVGFDGGSLVADQQGSTEVENYSFPNGYYVLIGTQLYLFLLDKINKIDYKNGEMTATYYDVTGIPTQITLQDRKTYLNDSYYLYKGLKTTNITLIEHNTEPIIGVGLANLRKIIISDSVLEISRLSNVANPDDGYYISNSLEVIGDYAFSGSASTKYYIGSQSIKTIGNYAFPNTTNTRFYLCQDPLKAEEMYFGSSYIAPPSTLVSVGDYAFNGLGISVLNLTSCSSLIEVGVEAFSPTSSCKDIYYLESTLGNGINNKIYLPNDIPYSIGEYSQNNSDYTNPTGGTSAQNNKSKEKRTFGSILSGVTFHCTNQEVDTL